MKEDTQIYITSDIAKVTGEKESYIYNSGLENDYYKSLIMKYITKYGKASRKELENLLKDKLPATLSDDNKVNRVRYLLKMLRKEKKYTMINQKICLVGK